MNGIKASRSIQSKRSVARAGTRARTVGADRGLWNGACAGGFPEAFWGAQVSSGLGAVGKRGQSGDSSVFSYLGETERVGVVPGEEVAVTRGGAGGGLISVWLPHVCRAVLPGDPCMVPSRGDFHSAGPVTASAAAPSHQAVCPGLDVESKWLLVFPFSGATWPCLLSLLREVSQGGPCCHVSENPGEGCTHPRALAALEAGLPARTPQAVPSLQI